MKDTPKWILELINKEKLTCNKCKMKFSVEHLVSVGVQKSFDNSNKEKLIIGLYCEECDEMGMFELKDMSLIDLAFEVLDDESDNKIRETEEELDSQLGKEVSYSGKKRKSRTKSKITIKEVKAASKFLKTCNHYELLEAMGWTPEDIDFYNKKPDNNNNKKEK